MKKKLEKIFSIIFLLCLVKIFHIGYFSSHFSFKTLSNSFSEFNNEAESLDIYANDLIPIKKYLIKKEINSYKIEDQILNDCEALCQRIIEFNYPIKHIRNSNYIISFTKNKFVNCKKIIKTKNLSLNECSKNL
tara:strand:+ start:51 stop:452 length:402 start_codon:yes stop_codon:yes gene_type:complete